MLQGIVWLFDDPIADLLLASIFILVALQHRQMRVVPQQRTDELAYQVPVLLHPCACRMQGDLTCADHPCSLRSRWSLILAFQPPCHFCSETLSSARGCPPRASGKPA